MRYWCPKRKREVDAPDECGRCEHLVVYIPVGWMCAYPKKAEEVWG